MRTTLTLDDDVADKLRRLAHRQGRPFKEVVNAVLRRGLSSTGTQSATTPFRVRTFASRFRPGVDPERLNQLVDDLEARDRGDRAR
ncbi:MAG: hypothetical protein FJ144_10790 [Deltaproteobacteria bacterium]|nr:hypothetical protein [Deltaproteobacteria bacterium]